MREKLALSGGAYLNNAKIKHQAGGSAFLSLDLLLFSKMNNQHTFIMSFNFRKTLFFYTPEGRNTSAAYSTSLN